MMQHVATLFKNQSTDPYLGPAEVVAVNPGGKVDLKISAVYGDSVLSAQTAVPFRLRPGDRVLALCHAPDVIYIIGILDPAQDRAPSGKRLVLPDGTTAVADGPADHPTLKIYSKSNRLMLEYDAACGIIRVTAPDAQIQVNAPYGDMALTAANHIRLEADQVDIVGRTRIGLRIGQSYERLKSALSLRNGLLQLGADKLDLAAKRGELNIEEIRSRSKQMISRIGTIQTIAEKIETAAATIIEKTKSTYRSSEELTQQKAGRLRMLIDRTLHIKSKHAILKSEDDVKIKAETINLG